MTPPVSDLVRESKLETQFHRDFVQHVHFVAGRTPRQRRVRQEERWIREFQLGRGAFGVVNLEKCIHGDAPNRLRAVKELRKFAAHTTYHRELEAIALFSYSKYERCFVKSFGWYEDEHSIFITMEYLPAGDLHQYLKSPLPEEEGKHIVSQILEGLDFMHSNNFTHRDLKPANILVVSKGPEWWVKLADFGISKRATEEHTALRTQVGTPAFMAPEVLGFSPSGAVSSISYTNAVDIWSIGVIAFLILTGETLFTNLARLHQFVTGGLQFPEGTLVANNVSRQGRLFVKGLMEAEPQRRPSAKESLQNPWLEGILEEAVHENERTTHLPSSNTGSSYHAGSEASAGWSSTQKSNTNYQQHHSMTVQRGQLKDLQESVNQLSLQPVTTSVAHGEGKWSLSSVPNLARCIRGSSPEPSNFRNSTKRRPVNIRCPGQDCESTKACAWICPKCLIPIDYGFSDQYFYCSCGRALYNEYEFKCNNSKHGSAFERFKQADLLQMLQKLPGYNELNILVLGPIASGKSTFINAFISYLSSQTFDEAVNSNDFQWVASCPFSLQTISSDGEIQDTRISIDSVGKTQHDHSPNEPEKKSARIYTITRGMTRYRLIDTPGMGNREFHIIDDQNMADIITTMREYNDLDLSGVLILLKPNISRVSVHFRAYMEKILSILHRDFTENIVFGFTHTRNVNAQYAPGDSSTSLKTFLSNLPGIGISLAHKNSYCFDSEAFRFLAAKNHGIMMAPEHGLENSWTHSRREVWRMLHHLKSRPPVLTASIVAIDETRRICNHLAKSAVDAAQMLQVQEHVLEGRLQELQETEKKLARLLPSLNVNKVALRRTPLAQPRLVCTNTQCAKYMDDGTGSGRLLIIYRTHCQDPCYLKGVMPDTLPDSLLLGCAAFEGKEHCKVCRHRWTEHLRILSELERYSTTVMDHDVEKAIKAEAGIKTSIQAAIAQVQKAIDVYRSELDQLLRAVARINLWLSEVSLLASEDTFTVYLDVLIGEERLKFRSEGSDRRLRDIDDLRDKYKTMVTSLARDTNNFNFRPMERERMVQALFKLEHYGKSLEDDWEVVRQTHSEGRAERTDREVLCAIASSGR